MPVNPTPPTRSDTPLNPTPATRVGAPVNTAPGPAMGPSVGMETNVAPWTPGMSSPRIEPAPIAAAQAPVARPGGTKLPIIAILIAFIIILVIGSSVAVIFKFPEISAWLGAATTPTPPVDQPSPTPPGSEQPSPTPVEAVRTFNYSITLRKNPEKFPNEPSVQIPGEVLFSPGDRIHISFISPQPGYLYIINESPPVKEQPSSFNFLFPTSQGSAQISAGQNVRIPDHDVGFVFDKDQGAEKLLLIWAAEEVAALESLKKWANPEDKGEIKDPSQVESLRSFLGANSAVNPQIIQDALSRQTTVKMTGDILVKPIILQHY
jgi:hypothetical protein